MVLAEFLAIGAAICFAGSSIFIKKGLEHSDTQTGVIVSLTVNVLVLWCILFITTPLTILLNTALLVFVAAAFLAPGIARLLRFESLDKIGVSRTAPITATTPLYATALAVIFLGEKLTLPIAVGMLLIITGTIVISKSGKLNKEDLIFALAASLLAGISTPIRKFGLTMFDYPIAVAAVTAVTAFTVAFVYISIKGNFHKIRNVDIHNKGTRLFAYSGMLTSIAFILNFSALSRGNVVVVAPLLQTMPIFSLLFAHMFLSHTEKVTLKIWIGTLIVISGVLVLTISGGLVGGLS